MPVSSDVRITFDVAHKYYRPAGSNNASHDTLSVLISSDCGATFTTKYKKWGINLETAGQSSSSYVNPSASDWRTETINLNSSEISGGTLSVVFRNSNEYGNNIFIDNISINLVPPKPTITADSSTTFCEGGSVTLRSNTVSGNQWYKNGGAIIGAMGSTLTASESGTYTVAVILNGIESLPSNAIDVTVNSNQECPCQNLQTWNTPINVIGPYSGTGGRFGEFPKLLLVNGNPAMAAYDGTRGSLLFIRATNAAGTEWAPPVPVDIIGNVGLWISMQIVNGNPAISYYDATNRDLKYVRATNATGTAWAAPVTIDTTGNVGQYTSLQVVKGYPAISYYDFTNEDLKYVSATDSNGFAWAAPVTIDFTGSVGQWTSLQVVNGNPAISYCISGSRSLKYIRATNDSGTGMVCCRYFGFFGFRKLRSRQFPANC